MDIFDLASTNERVILDLRQMGITAVPVIGHYSYRRASRGLKPETHQKHFELTYLVKGVQIYETGGQRTVLRGGDVYLTRPGERHSTAGQPEEKGEAYWLFVQRVPAGGRFLNLSPESTAAAMHLLLHGNVRRWRATRDVGLHLKSIFELYQSAQNLPLVTDELAARVTLLFLELLKGLHSPGAQQVAGPIGRLLEGLKVDGKWGISIAELAAEANLSDARFKVRFKEEAGIPPGEFLMRRRIEKAKSYLRKSKRRIADIARELGFPTAQYFATVFKRYTGRRPLEYRTRKTHLAE